MQGPGPHIVAMISFRHQNQIMEARAVAVYPGRNILHPSYYQVDLQGVKGTGGGSRSEAIVVGDSLGGPQQL